MPPPPPFPPLHDTAAAAAAQNYRQLRAREREGDDAVKFSLPSQNFLWEIILIAARGGSIGFDLKAALTCTELQLISCISGSDSVAPPCLLQLSAVARAAAVFEPGRETRGASRGGG